MRAPTCTFHHESAGTTGCIDTALLTIVVTSGTSPAAAAMKKLVDPWQWTMAFIRSCPVSATMRRTAIGWS